SAATAMKTSGDAMISYPAEWCSPIHASSKPRRSRWQIISRSRSRASVGFWPTGWKGARKIPKRMTVLLTWIRAAGEESCRRLHRQRPRPGRRQVIVQVGDQVRPQRGVPGIAPQISPLVRVGAHVVQLPLAPVVREIGQRDGSASDHAGQIPADAAGGLLVHRADVAVAIDGPEVHADLGELAVPFGEDALPTGAGRRWQ